MKGSSPLEEPGVLLTREERGALDLQGPELRQRRVERCGQGGEPSMVLDPRGAPSSLGNHELRDRCLQSTLAPPLRDRPARELPFGAAIRHAKEGLEMGERQFLTLGGQPIVLQQDAHALVEVGPGRAPLHRGTQGLEGAVPPSAMQPELFAVHGAGRRREERAQHEAAERKVRVPPGLGVDADRPAREPVEDLAIHGPFARQIAPQVAAANVHGFPHPRRQARGAARLLASLLLTAALAGCPGPTPGPDPTPPPAADTDGDGVPDEDDCAPEDANVYPGAEDTCDGVDTDCVDDPEDVDEDGDGVPLCAGDCDDTDGTRFPGNEEDDACDGVDADCVHDAGEYDWDGDGVFPCAGDCRDDLHVVYPGAEEVCDGWDNDCDGMRDDIPYTGAFPTGEAALSDVAWAILYGEVEGETAGRWATGLGDMNGDGYGDIAVSTWPSPNLAPGRAARVLVVYGPVCGEASLAMEPDGVAGATILGLGDVSYVGDVNGDGLDDLHAGGRIFFGPLSGERTMDDFDIAFVNWDHWQSKFMVRHGPDLNGDGVPDIAVGDYGGLEYGRVAIFFGPFGPGLYDVNAADATLHGPPDLWGLFGSGLDSPGDLDGDGFDDLVVGAPFANATGLMEAPWNGSAFVFHGPFQGDRQASTAEAVIRGTSPNAVFGRTVERLGDTDGDGALEYAVAAPADYVIAESAVHVFEGVMSGEVDVSMAASVFWEQDYGSEVGTVLGGGDLDGDGRPDLIITAPWEASGGSLYVLSGGDTLRLTDALSPRSVSATANIDGAGAVDLVVGSASWESAPGVWRGAVLVVAGAGP